MNGWLIVGVLMVIVVAAVTAVSFTGRKGGFRKAVEDATAELKKRGCRIAPEPSEGGAIKDLEIQWNDHFHMRDQTWRTLSNSALFFIGIVGLEIYQGTPRVIMMAGYAALILLSVLGLMVALHHRRIQQKVKLPIILRYEVILGLVPAFEDILERHSNKGLSTSTFIVFAHAAMCIVSVLLLVMKVYEAQTACGFTLACVLERGPAEPGVLLPP